MNRVRSKLWGELLQTGARTPFSSTLYLTVSDTLAIQTLSYGVEKYVLLRVGPFPDLYESMASQHAARGDESSSLIAAETSNGKFTGFGSTFAFYAKLLSSFPNREEEAKDAARMCLRLPISSIGKFVLTRWQLYKLQGSFVFHTWPPLQEKFLRLGDFAGLAKEDLRDVAVMAGLAEKSDSTDEAIAKLQTAYEKIRQHEQEEDPTGGSGITPEQVAIEEANYLLDTVSLTGGKWSEIRSKLGEIYSSVGRDDMAVFVDPSRS